MNLIGGGGPLEFNMQVLIANKFKGFLELPCIWIFGYDLSHMLWKINIRTRKNVSGLK